MSATHTNIPPTPNCLYAHTSLSDTRAPPHTHTHTHTHSSLNSSLIVLSWSSVFQLIKSFLRHPQSFQKGLQYWRHLRLTLDRSLLPALRSDLSLLSMNQKVNQRPRPTVRLGAVCAAAGAALHLQTGSTSLTLTGRVSWHALCVHVPAHCLF